jgi:hypothetical protein
LPRQTRAIPEEKISAGKRATSVEDGNSTDDKDKAGRTIAALSTKAPAKPNGPTKNGQTDTGKRNSSAEDMNAGRSNGSAEDRKPARSKDMDHAEGKGRKAPVQELEKARGTIAALATTDGSTRRSKSPRMPTRSKGTKGTKGVDGTGQGRKDSLEKRILAASQTAEAPESLRYPESRRSTSEDSVTQKEAELSEKRTEPATSDDITGQSMAKGCIEMVSNDNTTEPMAKVYIEPVDVDSNDEGSSDMDMRLGYFGLGLHDQMEVPEADQLLEVIGLIEG